MTVAAAANAVSSDSAAIANAALSDTPEVNPASSDAASGKAATSVAAGLDLGATLSKVVIRASSAAEHDFESFLLPAHADDAIRDFLAKRGVEAVGVTGAGASRFLARLDGDLRTSHVSEFDAWGGGERTLLRTADFVPTKPHLLVSVGTGTSILKVDADGNVSRVGGTALGGGTLRGLGLLLSGEADHDRLADLARRGSRHNVDLLVADLYPGGDISIAGDLTAANFGKVESRTPEDLVKALTRLVAENVGLLAGALASAHGKGLDVVYAGTTLRQHEELKDILAFSTSLMGARGRFLPRGEFCGAVGALEALETLGS